MRVLLAFDKFKDSLSARDACVCAAMALRSLRPDWTLDLCPLTDGGEGFAEILTEAAGGELLTTHVTGPRGTPVAAQHGLVPANRIPAGAWRQLNLPAAAGSGDDRGAVAVIEMAQASGLALLPAAKRDPWRASTLGTGELIRAAMDGGARAILLGVGGSATHDLGLGALSALGYSFRTAQGQACQPPVPAIWASVVRIEGKADPALPPIRIACDVTNPLLGPNGAAAVYGPQKGLRASDYAALEQSSARLAAELCRHCGCPPSLPDAPGTGAAGGCSFGLMAGAGAELLPGYAFVSAWLDLERRLAMADLVITGEGRFDESSLSGKGPGALAARALALGRQVHVFAGRVSAPPREGLTLHALTPPDVPLEQALRETEPRLESGLRNTFA